MKYRQVGYCAIKLCDVCCVGFSQYSDTGFERTAVSKLESRMWSGPSRAFSFFSLCSALWPGGRTAMFGAYLASFMLVKCAEATGENVWQRTAILDDL